MIVTRFAPSPTGMLHLGHAHSALLNAATARQAQGRFLLRIEDIDAERCRPHFEAAILEDLTWLGIAWDRPVLRQSERLAFYAEALAGLSARGLVYRCFRSRRDIGEAMSAPHAPPHTRPHAGSAAAFRGTVMSALEERANLAEGRPFAWRLSLAAAEAELGTAFAVLSFAEEIDGRLVAVPAEPWRFGDVVLGRKDNGTSYHLASVLDDAAQGVTHVIRGEDLREAAGLHTLLQRLLGLPAPVYRHHRLIAGPDGRRLSKRDGAASLRALREAGVSPAEVESLSATGMS